MKPYKHFLTLMLAMLLCINGFSAFAQDDDTDPWEDETETPVVTTTLPNTTAPLGTLPSKTTQPDPTKPAPAEVAAPLVRITRQNLPRKIGAGESFTVTALFHNYGSVSLLQGLAVFEPGEGLVLAEKSDSKVVPVIGPNGIGKVDVRLRASKDYTATDIPVTVSYAYTYRTPDGIVSATASDRLIIPMQTPAQSTEKSAETANATPNIIVSRYNYGGTIAAGDTFTLHLEFTNTSRILTAENIVMAVETGESVSITSASNTYYYASLGAGKTAAQDIPMRVSATAGAQGAKVDIAFRYEYVDNGTRGSASANESLSIPIYTPDRFIVTRPDTELIGIQGEEMAVSIPYVNKGKSDVSNVQADLIFEEGLVYCEQPHINLGNFDPGKSGTIDFYFTPSEAGSGTVQVLITYEDERMQEKKITVSVPYSVDEAYMEPDPYGEDIPDEPTPDSTLKKALWIAIPIAAVILAVVLIVVLKKRKKKKADAAVSFDWGFAQPEEKKNENS